MLPNLQQTLYNKHLIYFLGMFAVFWQNQLWLAMSHTVIVFLTVQMLFKKNSLFLIL